VQRGSSNWSGDDPELLGCAAVHVLQSYQLPHLRQSVLEREESWLCHRAFSQRVFVPTQVNGLTFNFSPMA
jgi:hypothetical protein